ncbi:Hypothetical protein PFCIRM138_08765 [Propionibacterium freudenreichii subsp. freudenreichii]|uniref:Uncharacterized protein n=2 Tax=Propionibacterium freudenreichii TaxID=1744 RepID=A0A0B7NXA6_PROFF|nr:Hypothetical protein PFCIRM138_08765 [Propionibacterium freudenreichii subsp. freudenreichii]
MKGEVPRMARRHWWRRIIPGLSTSVRLVAIGVAVLVVAVMTVVNVMTSKNTNQPGSRAGTWNTALPSTGVPTAASSSSNAVSTDSRAYSELVRLSDQGWTATQPLTNQWVAELGSSVVVPPSQPTPTPSGSASPSGAPAALARFESAQKNDPGAGREVRLLRRSTYNPPVVDDRFTFVIIVSNTFSTADDVRNWCSDQFGSAPPDRCDPLQLHPR